MASSDFDPGLEPAVAAGDDPRDFARVLSDVYDAAMSGRRMPARPRPVISDSWHRVQSAGVDPDVGLPDGLLDIDEVQSRRQTSPLAMILDDLTGGLDAVIRDGDNILVVADVEGRVLWRSGATRVLQRADRLGFVEGANWAENSVGTNAIGTALTSGRPVQVFSAEHFVRSHHAWTCTGAPITDPRTGRLVGVVDVSGPAQTIHPTTLALVDAVAKLAESRLRDRHRQNLDGLRSVAAPMLARLDGPALAVDEDGWVAAVGALTPRPRLVLPRRLAPGRRWLSGLGECELEPLPGGWLIRPVEAGSETAITRVELDLRGRPPRASVVSGAGSWTQELSPRHAQILQLMVDHPTGCTAAQISRVLFGVAGHTSTVRAEISRLRRRFGSLVAANPYRFADGVEVHLVAAADTAASDRP